MKKILVTGASGFIGVPTVRLLTQRGYEVHAVCTRASHELELKGVQVYHADLLDRSQSSALVEGIQPDALIHLAWIATPGVYQQSPDNLTWARESLYLLECFVRCGGQRAVTVGSCFEYDRSYGFLRENITPDRPDTLYGAAKLSFSLLARAYAAQVGLSLACARLFYLFGERESPSRAIPYAILSGLRGERIKCQTPAAVRDYMSENEAARALCDLLKSDVQGVVNVASGEGPTMSDIFEFIAGELGVSDRLERGDTPADPSVTIGDTRKLRGDAGFTPRENWRAGILRCIEWWKKNEGRA